jgi:signal peptidase I
MFEAFRVPSHSMAPNIAFNDRVIANKLAFRRKSPQRGDVVLFDHPDTLRGHYVKRVVALGGDTVEIRDGELLINGQILERTRVAKKSLNTDKGKLEGDVFWETNGDAHYQIFISDRTSGKDLQPENFGPVTVPEYQCFVMGDNRNLSFDSRNFGSLSIGALRGKFKYVYWPLAHRSRMDAP